MALEWIKSFKKLERDPKTLHFMSLMRWSKSETIGFLHRFWWWADDMAPDGVVTSLCLPGVVGGALGYSPEIGDKAAEKMKESKWLDVLESGEVVVHDVGKYRASSPEKREATKERVRKHRENKMLGCVTTVKRECNALQESYGDDVTLLDEEEETDKDKHTTTTTPTASESLLRLCREILGLTCEALVDNWLSMWPEEWIILSISKCQAKEMRGNEASIYAQGMMRRWKKNGGPDNDYPRTGRNHPRTNPSKARTREPADFSDVVTGEKL